MKVTDEIIAAIHDCREMPYPEEVSTAAMVDIIKAAMDCILEGDVIKGVTGLATLVDTLESIPKRH